MYIGWDACTIQFMCGGQKTTFYESVFSSVIQVPEINSDHQIGQPVPFPTKQSCWLCILIPLNIAISIILEFLLFLFGDRILLYEILQSFCLQPPCLCLPKAKITVSTSYSDFLIHFCLLIFFKKKKDNNNKRQYHMEPRLTLCR